ncbi:hypothetical protein [Catenulispora subtropica]|uniref:Uncharacterized protein n=1 Tax=Catenulispora subtropica TaxID=450798 RepID=A0ABN2SCS0_9ACTN
MLYFNTFNISPAGVYFEVGYALLPLSYWEFSGSLHPYLLERKEPDRAGIFLNAYLMPPNEWSFRPDETPPYAFRRRWALDDLDGLDACGTALAQRLTEEAFPRMRWLLDMENALAELTTPTFATRRALGSDPDRELILTVDVADPARIEQLLADPARSRDPDIELWVRERRGLTSP